MQHFQIVQFHAPFFCPPSVLQAFQTRLKGQTIGKFSTVETFPFYYSISMTHCIYLWWGSQVDDALQLHPGPELFHQEGVPVLVDGPLCRTDTAQLKQVQGKDVSGRTQHISGLKKTHIHLDWPSPSNYWGHFLCPQRAPAAPSYPQVTDLSL